MRVGIGYDIHRLAPGRPLILGGVEIPYAKGPLGHSDADVILHALCDAMLGALGLGDIGEHFPDNNPAYKGISSIKLLNEVYKMISARSFSVEHVDITVIIEEPRLGPFKDGMRRRVAEALRVDVDRVNVKAKTGEGVGAIGRGEAVAAFAAAALKPAGGP